jgi:hypothetical protein
MLATEIRCLRNMNIWEKIAFNSVSSPNNAVHGQFGKLCNEELMICTDYLVLSGCLNLGD